MCVCVCVREREREREREKERDRERDRERTYLGFFFSSALLSSAVTGMQLTMVGLCAKTSSCCARLVVDSWKPASGQQVPGKKVLGLLNRLVYTGCQAHRPFSRQQVPCIPLVNCCCTQPSSFRETKPLHATTFYPDHSTVLPTQCSTGDHVCVLEQKDCMSQCMVFAPNEEPCQFYAKTTY